jgi:hypothetical protein
MGRMRKRFISENIRGGNDEWLNLEAIAQVELTSEEPERSIEAALTGAGLGWRAGRPGEQVIRVLFDEPVRLRRIWLRFDEDAPRTQEFVVRCSPDRGHSYREVVRQQYTFSPPGTTREVEDYTVDLPDVTVLELRIAPDIHGGTARASLKELRVA